MEVPLREGQSLFAGAAYDAEGFDDSAGFDGFVDDAEVFACQNHTSP